jgi:hypothetical protein
MPAYERQRLRFARLCQKSGLIPEFRDGRLVDSRNRVDPERLLKVRN